MHVIEFLESTTSVKKIIVLLKTVLLVIFNQHCNCHLYYNTPLFDLGGLSSNNNFSLEEEIYLLENYFEKKIDDKLMLQYNCLKSASLLRETMWSMVSEISSKIDADYASYTQENLTKFDQAYKELNL